VAPGVERYGDFGAFLGGPADYTDAWQALRRSKISGRPLGTVGWVADLDVQTGRTLAAQKRAPKPKVRCI
jgi:hypothetical protein